SDFVGVYGLASIDNESPVRSMPDGSTIYTAGIMRTESSGAYSYSVLIQTCYFNGCTSPDLYESKGTWTANSSNVTLKDSDGSSESWHFASHEMSGTSSHLNKASTKLVFRRCDEAKEG